MLRLLHRLIAAALIQPLAWELPYAAGVAVKAEKNKQLRNKPKEVKDSYSKNYKTLIKEIKEDSKKWKDTPCS